MNLQRLTVGVVGAIVLGACASAPTVTIENYRPIKPESCAKVISSLPGELLSQGRRPITSSSISPMVAAWGDPVIVVKCAVTVPVDAQLAPDVVTVNGIDWRYEELSNGTRFFSNSLSTMVEIDVPKKYENPTDVLVDLADPLSVLQN